jgi:hypothetical protein
VSTRIATAAGAGPDTRFFLPFAKVEEKSDGSVYVEGIATGEVKDHHGEIILHDASVEAFKEWTEWAEKATAGASLGNIREMHDPVGAGKAVKWEKDDTAKTNSLGALVIDKDAGLKTKERVYTGFSIGGDQVKREIREVNGEKVPVITSYRLTEVSLVDKPACPIATFTMVKRLKETPMKDESAAAPQLAEGEEILRTIKTPDGQPAVFVIAKKGEKAVPRTELAKGVGDTGAAALQAIKAFLVEVLGSNEGADIWTLDDAMSALRYMWFAKNSAEANAAMTGKAVAATELKKSDTPADPPPAEKPTDTPTNQDPADKPKDDAPAPPAPATDVPPSASSEVVENAVKAQLVPVIETIAKLLTLVEPVAKALQEGGLVKAAGTQAPDSIEKAENPTLKKIGYTLEELKKAVEALPAPPAGRRVHKSIGAVPEGGTGSPLGQFETLINGALEKAAAAGASKQEIQRMRLAFAEEAFKANG